MVEKVVLSLVYAIRRLRPYFQSPQVVVKTDHPIANILRKLELVGRMVAWSVNSLNSVYFMNREGRSNPNVWLILFLTCKKGLHIGEKWILYVDGSSNKKGSKSSIVLKGPEDVKVEQSLVLKYKTSNSQVEYEALIAKLHLAKDMGLKKYFVKLILN